MPLGAALGPKTATAMSPSAPPQPPAPSLSGFGTLQDLQCRGRLVFLRADPSLATVSRTQPAVEPEPGGEPPTEPGAQPPAEPGPTLVELLKMQARVVVGTHLTGDLERDEGMKSIEQLGLALSESLQVEVLVPDEHHGEALKMIAADLRPGQICLLPNLLDHPGEASADEGFARALATFVDSYVGDAFGASHERYATTTILPRLCARSALGEQARRELLAARAWLAHEAAPRLAIIGGDDLAGKMSVIDSLLPRLDTLCLTGGPATTMLAASTAAGAKAEQLALARALSSRCRDRGIRLVLPSDLRVRAAGADEARVVTPATASLRDTVEDIGPESEAQLAEEIAKAGGALLWGPCGRVELEAGRTATRSLLEGAGRGRGPSLLVGGALRKLCLREPALAAAADLASTGSRALLTLLGGGQLPGIEALRRGG